MYSTKTAIQISLKDILDGISDYDIYAYYIGKFKVGKLYNSPLRNNDLIPSFAIFPSRNGDLLFKDHGSGQFGNAITFVKLKLGTDDRGKIEKELLRIKKFHSISDESKRTIHYKPNNGDIGIVRQPFNVVDIVYWNQFGITIDTLKYYNVYSIKYYLYNNIVKGIYNNLRPMYAFKIYNHFKIYRPLSSKYVKWRTNTNVHDVQGLEQLMYKSESLIITKSLKDIMVLYEMGIDSISPSSETTFIPDDILQNLKTKYTKIYILFDRDKTGMLRARKLSKYYNIPAFFINKKFKSKDISDAVKNNGFEPVKNWLLKIL